MLQTLSPMAVVALTRAHEARERANSARFGADRQFWLEIERRWVKLAQSHEAQGRLGTYLKCVSLEGNAPDSSAPVARRSARNARQAAIAGSAGQR
jgi:hypothetical protein